MAHSPFPWSEGESFILDAKDEIVCREPNHIENGRNWKDDRKLIVAIPQMVEALAGALEHLEDMRDRSSGERDSERVIAEIESVLTLIKPKG